MSRRKAVHQMMLSVAALSIASCAPLRLVMDAGQEPEPETYITLRTFLETVVPGAPPEPDLGCYTNEVFGFSKYVKGFTEDLNRRSNKYFNREFQLLKTAQRELVVRSGLESGRLISTLYTGAVFLTQIAVYTGMTNSYSGCPLIEFDGTFRKKPVPVTTEVAYFGRSLTSDGNPH